MLLNNTMAAEGEGGFDLASFPLEFCVRVMYPLLQPFEEDDVTVGSRLVMVGITHAPDVAKPPPTRPSTKSSSWTRAAPCRAITSATSSQASV